MHDTGFVAISNVLFEALLRARLTGAQWRVLLWVIRATCGWNRRWTSFTWYRIAKELTLDRAVVYRAGRALVNGGMLLLVEGQLGLPTDHQLSLASLNAVGRQRKPLLGRNETVAPEQRARCQDTTLFRRDKDRCKDNLKTYKNKRVSAFAGVHATSKSKGERQHLAGAAQPIPGKYDSLSEN